MAQQVGEEIAAGGHRNAVPVVVAAHDAHRPGFADHAAERIEVHLVEFARGDVGIGAAVAVAAALRDAVSRVVFERRGDALRLDAADHLDAQFGDQERVFAVALHDAAPAGIARHVEDRGVDVPVAQDPGFESGDLARTAHQRPVPGRSDGDGRRERRGAAVVQAVDALVGELRGDAQPGLLDEPALDRVLRLDVARVVGDQMRRRAQALAHAVEHLVDVGDAVLPDLVLPLRGGQRVAQHAAVAVERGQLAALLFEGHAAEQVLDPFVEAARGVLVGVHAAVLVEVDPAFAVDRLGCRLPCLGGRRGDGGCEQQDCNSGFLHRFGFSVLVSKIRFRSQNYKRSAAGIEPIVHFSATIVRKTRSGA